MSVLHGVFVSPQNSPELVLAPGMSHRATFGVEPCRVVDSARVQSPFEYHLSHRGRWNTPRFLPRNCDLKQCFKHLVEIGGARANELGALQTYCTWAEQSE